MGVKIRTKNNKLYLDIYHDGIRKWQSLGLTVSTDKQQQKEIMKLAEIIRSKKEAQLASGEYNVTDFLGGKQTLNSFMETMKKNDSLKKVLIYLNRYNGNIELKNINEKWLESFLDYLNEDTALSKSTVNLYFGYIKQALKKATRDRLIPRNPALSIKNIKVPETEIVFLDITEIQKLAATPIEGILGNEIKRAFLFACFTGFRISDIKSIKKSDINRNTFQIAKRQVKTGRITYIPIHETAWKIIDDGIENEFVFPLLSKSKFKTNRYLIRWAKRAGINKDIGWHTARRTFAVLSLESGVEIFTVSKLLGHTDLKTTLVYAKATDKMKKEAVLKLPGVDL
jgi:integrase